MTQAYRRVPLKRFGRIVGGSTPRDEERYWGGQIPWYTPTDVSVVHGGRLGASARTLTDEGLRSCSASLLPAGSVVLTSRAPIGNVAITDRAAATNQGCKSLVPAPGVDARFVAYAAQALSAEIRIAGTGTTFQEVSAERLGSVRFPYPGHERQRAIADVLDRECARLDEARDTARDVADALRAKIDDLRETLLVAEDAARLKSFGARIRLGPFGSALSADEYVDGATPVINPVHLNRGRLAPDPSITVPERRAADLSGWLLAPGDVVTARRGELGRNAVVRRADLPALCGTGCAFIRGLNGLQPEFLAMVLDSRPARASLELAAVGATMLNLDTDALLNLRVPLLAVEEQSRRVAAFASKEAELARSAELAARVAARFADYRASLIHEAVTGELDVADMGERQLEERRHAAAEGQLDEAAA